MYFQHADAVRERFPELVAGALAVRGLDGLRDVTAQRARHEAAATAKLDGRAESELPEIQAWRRAFSRMGLKPTQYR